MNIPDRLTPTTFSVKLAAVLTSIIAIGFLVILGKELLSPLLFSCLFAILLLPLAQWLEVKCRLPRSVASIIAVLLFVTSVMLVLYLIGAQVSRLSTEWPLFKEQLSVSISSLQQWINQKFHVSETKQLNYIGTATNNLLNSGTTMVGATLISLSGMLLFLVFTFIYTFLFLVYRSLIKRFMIAVFAEEYGAVVHEILEQVQIMMRKYIVGLLLETVIVATVVATAFTIMGVKYALLLGIITGLLNLVPYIGIFTSLLISSLITFATATDASQVLLVIITLVVIHLLDSNILLPLIVGSKVKINALVTLIGVLMGEMMWGIPGMFLSIPVIAVMKIIFDRVNSLQAWGILLGDDEARKKEQKIKVIAKQTPEQ